jgi:hypothetical protein
MRNVRNGLTLTLVYLVTRVPFLVFRPIYYDSFEYVSRIRDVSSNTLVASIRGSHPPVHALYIGLAGVVRIITHLPPEQIYTLLSVFFGLFAVLLWYTVLLRFFRNYRDALWGALTFTLFPGFWRTTTNILYEPLLLAFQAGTMAAMLMFFETKRTRYTAAAVLCFTAAQLTFIGNIFSILPIMVLAALSKPKQITRVIVGIIIALAAACVVDRMILGSWPALIQNYVAHAADTISPTGGTFIILGRILRNIVLITSLLASPLAAAIALIAVWTLRRTKRLVALALAFCAVSFIEMQYWHAGYYGRIGIPVLFPLSLILGRFLGKRTLLGVGLSIVLAINIFILGTNQQKVPYITALNLWAQRAPDAVFVTGDATRFAFTAKANVFVVRNPDHDIGKLTEAIQANKHVYLDTSVLTYPYNQPDGWEYQLLSKQNKQGILTAWFTQHCTLHVAYEYPSVPPLVVYEATNCAHVSQISTASRVRLLK